MIPRPVEIHIEKLVLDGPLAPGGTAALGAALEAELARLVEGGGILPRTGSPSSLDAGTIALRPGGSTAGFGIQLARSVYSTLGGSGKGSP